MSEATQSPPGCAVRPAIDRKPRTISVNGTIIQRDAIARETQNHPATKPIEAWQAAARALAIRELLLQEARRLDFAAEPISDGEGRRETEDEALIRAVIDREIAVPSADEATCRRYFDQNRKRFRSPALHEVAHILIPAPAEPDARAAARETAEMLINALARDPSAFGALALAHSACPSGKTGGSLGQIGPGQTVPEFEAALERMVPGPVHPEPVETRYGLHIIRLDRRIEGRDLPFEIAQPLIADYLDARVRRVAERHYIAQLASRAVIEGIDLPSANSPLVQ